MAPKRLVSSVALALVAVVAAGCGSGGDDATGPTPATSTATQAVEPTRIPPPTPFPLGAAPATPPAGMDAAMRAELAATTGRPPSDFTLVLFEARTWPDGCLGLGEPGRACSQALVPGWYAIFRTPDGTEYRFRAGPVAFTREP